MNIDDAILRLEETITDLQEIRQQPELPLPACSTILAARGRLAVFMPEFDLDVSIKTRISRPPRIEFSVTNMTTYKRLAEGYSLDAIVKTVESRAEASKEPPPIEQVLADALPDPS